LQADTPGPLFQLVESIIMAEIFDDWPEKYDLWFETPIGRLIKDYESKLVIEMLVPAPEEVILDAGCGTGVFAADILETGARVVGLDLSLTMLRRATLTKCPGQPFQAVIGDIRRLPFADASFHKSISITAIEFMEDARVAVEELFRVTKPEGSIVVATLNSLSPWAQRRKEAAQNGHPLFKHAIFRSPDEMKSLSSVENIVKTAIHFEKNDDPEIAPKIEKSGSGRSLNTGAFLAVRWIKPG
jgi:ubiquinone/menaquinone biosynthesis C-methylase UbiE